MGLRDAYIYLLVDPRTKQVRYVGQAVNPKARYGSHCASGGTTPLGQWLEELRREGRKPKLRVVCKIRMLKTTRWNSEEAAIMSGAERAVIQHYERRAPLTNTQHTKRASEVYRMVAVKKRATLAKRRDKLRKQSRLF